MNCPSCGAEVPVGSVVCPICGGPVVATPGMPYTASTPTQPEYMDLSPAKKKSPLLGIVVAIAVIGVLAAVFFFVLGGKYMGTYKLQSVTVSAYGVTETMTADDLEAYGMSGVSLKVYSPGRCKFTGLSAYSLTGPYKFKISGDEVTITGSDGSVYGEYDKSAKSITLTESEDGMEVSFVFAK